MRFDLEAVGRRLSPWGILLAGYLPLVALGLLGTKLINDEVVRGGASYISGHASSLFALLTPAMWAARRRKVKAGLAGWAAVHAYTRVYTAAHFPYCALMGSLFGFAVGTLVYFSFRRWVNPQPDGDT